MDINCISSVKSFTITILGIIIDQKLMHHRTLMATRPGQRWCCCGKWLWAHNLKSFHYSQVRIMMEYSAQISRNPKPLKNLHTLQDQEFISVVTPFNILNIHPSATGAPSLCAICSNLLRFLWQHLSKLQSLPSRSKRVNARNISKCKHAIRIHRPIWKYHCLCGFPHSQDLWAAQW